MAGCGRRNRIPTTALTGWSGPPKTAMTPRIYQISKRLLADTKGGAAIIVGLSLPVVLGFGALAVEYSTALLTRAQNQRTSDIAAYAAASEYTRNTSADPTVRIRAANAAADSVAALNGVSAGVTVSFDDQANATRVDVVITEDKPILLSRLVSRIESLTINTTSRVSLGEASDFKACILALDPSASEGFRVNGKAGTYNLTGCGIGSNTEIEANGQQVDTSCAAPSYKKPEKTCQDEQHGSGFTDPFADRTNWPNNASDDAVCDHIGAFPDDVATKDGGKGYRLKAGVLCVDAFSRKFPVFADPGGSGSTLIFKAGVDFEMKGGDSFSIKPPATGGFAGVAIYAPKSSIRMSGNPDFSIDGLSCSGLVAGALRFDGNVTLNAECGEDDVNFEAGGSDLAGRPRLIQ